jgi:hypothetical protein
MTATHEARPFQATKDDLPGIRCSCGLFAIKVGDLWDKPTKRGVIHTKARTMGDCWTAMRQHFAVMVGAA